MIWSSILVVTGSTQSSLGGVRSHDHPEILGWSLTSSAASRRGQFCMVARKPSSSPRARVVWEVKEVDLGPRVHDAEVVGRSMLILEL